MLTQWTRLSFIIALSLTALAVLFPPFDIFGGIDEYGFILSGPPGFAELGQATAMLGLQLGYLIGGSVLVETVFTWPGTGYLLNKAVLTRDIPLLQGTILVLATAFVLINLMVDLVQSVIDPRIKRN